MVSTLPLLPNLERASILTEKIRDYALNPNHPKGRDKARVFKAVLGIEQKHADAFAETIRGTLPRAYAEKQKQDQFGTRWATHHEIAGLTGKSAIVTVAWIYKAEAPDIPVLVSCYIDLERQAALAGLLGLR